MSITKIYFKLEGKIFNVNDWVNYKFNKLFKTSFVQNMDLSYNEISYKVFIIKKTIYLRYF